MRRNRAGGSTWHGGMVRVEEQLPQQWVPVSRWQQPGTEPWALHAQGMPKGCSSMPGPKLMDCFPASIVLSKPLPLKPCMCHL